MKRHFHSSGVQWFSFPILEQFPKLRCAVLSRQGGFSTGSYSSLNLAGNTGDDAACVERNVQKAKKALQEDWQLIKPLNLYHANQVHGKDWTLVDNKSPISMPDRVDILLTQTPHIDLTILQADCQTAIFYDPINHSLALTHSGWRGNVQNVYGNTVQAMQKAFGTRPENLFVAISPSLGPCHSQFINYKTELPESFWGYEVKPLYFNLWAISKNQLLSAGILEEHITTPSTCTYDHADDFFSYRREKKTGRNAVIAVLLP